MAQRRKRRAYDRDLDSLELLLDEDQRRERTGRNSRRKKEKKGGKVKLVLALLLFCALMWVAAGPIIEKYTLKQLQNQFYNL